MQTMKDYWKGWREIIFTLTYFALLAVLVPRAQAAHMGVQGMFFVLIGTGAALAMLYWIIRGLAWLIRKKREENPLSREDIKGYMSGGALASIYAGNFDDGDLTGGSSLVPVGSQSLVRLSPATFTSDAIDTRTLALIDGDHGNEEPPFPAYAPNETLRLGRAVASGQRFDPHVNGLIGQGLIAAAMQGWGKSQLIGRIVEQCGRCGMLIVLLDHKGEHATITELPYMNGLLAGSGDEFGFQLTTENADTFVRLVMQNRHQAIVNLPSYGARWLSRASIVAAVGRALMDYAEEQRRRRRRVLPCLVLLDEAQLYIPQDASLLPPEAQENKQVLGDLKNAYFALATNGRSAGYTMGFATQSLTFIAKWAIKSCAVQVFGRHVEKNALDMCESIIDSDVATRAELKSFSPGVGVVFGFTDNPMVVHFDKKESRDLSETPNIGWLRSERDTEPHKFTTRKAIIEMKAAKFADRDIADLLGMTEAKYWQTVHDLALDEPPASVSTSQASGVATSSPTSERRTPLRLVEAANEAARSGGEVAEAVGVEKERLSEREKQIADMFFAQRMNPGAIAKELSGGKGGDAFQKVSLEVADAIRKYAEVRGA